MTKEPTPDQTIEMLQRERDGLRDTVEGLRWMVDQMNKDSEAMVYDMETHGPVYAAVAYTFGPRCDDYDPGCPGCSAWAEHDEITRLRADNERLKAALEPFACMCSVKGEGVGGLCFKGSCLYWNARAALEGKDD